jgi:hypothetical protein
MQKSTSTNRQLNNLIEFRQAIYEQALQHEQDAQFELLDALTANQGIGSFPELSLSPFFRRRWCSAYSAVERGGQNREWLRACLAEKVTTNEAGNILLALDVAAWPRPDAVTLPDRQYVHSSTQDVTGKDIVVGQPYSLLAWVAAEAESWTLPVDTQRVRSKQTEVEVGVAQIKRFCEQRGSALEETLHVFVADGRYGNHRFLGPLRHLPCGFLVRLRCDRVLYGPPGPYSGLGRPRKHGDRFAFKEPETWGEPDQAITVTDERYGQVKISGWNNLHAREDTATVFTVLRIQNHSQRDNPPDPIWLAWQGPPMALDVLWGFYLQRPTIESAIRWRKQLLHWTLPEFQDNLQADNWSWLVSLAQWQLYLARPITPDCPLPWQSPQLEQTPQRVQQGIWVLFLQIDTPAAPPKTRGKSPGWPRGQPRTRRQRRPVVKKGDP